MGNEIITIYTLRVPSAMKEIKKSVETGTVIKTKLKQ